MTGTIPSEKKQFNHRRIFISENKKNFQIFSFNQRNDGSVYCSWPDFIDTEWLMPILGKNGPELRKINSVESGKLSIHGSGMCSFRSHNNNKNRPLIIKGNKLLDLDKKESGIRHLFTAFIKEPHFFSSSPALSKVSDYLIITQKIKPFVVIFFAIPQTGKEFEVNFQTSFHVDDVMVPPLGGWGVMELKFHNVFWYIYQTKKMEKWPKKTQVIFYDGYAVPFFIGTGIGQFRLELRKPTYYLNGNKLIVKV